MESVGTNHVTAKCHTVARSLPRPRYRYSPLPCLLCFDFLPHQALSGINVDDVYKESPAGAGGLVVICNGRARPHSSAFSPSLSDSRWLECERQRRETGEETLYRCRSQLDILGSQP